MASVTGSRLAFFADGVNPHKINIVLTTDGTSVPAPSTVPGAFNIEVFTSTPGALAAGYDASAFIQGAVSLTDNVVQAGTLGSTEQLLDGSYTVVDQTGHEAIQIVGTAAGGSSTTVVGSSGDTITGSTVAGNSQLIDASGKKPHAVAGAMSVIGGAGPTTVWGGGHDSIVGSAGALTVNETKGHPGLESIVGGAGSLTAYDLGKHDTISGSTGGTTFIDDSKVFSGGSQITGGSGTTGTLADGENTFIKAGAGDSVTGGTDLTLIDATRGTASVLGGSGTVTGTIAGLTGVNTVIKGGKADTITGGAGATYINATAQGAETITGGAGNTTVLAGKGDNITGGTGATTVEGANLDTITGNTGALLVDITAKSSGAETVNLTAGHGVATLRDVNPGATTTGAHDKTSVTGFATATDSIASATSVLAGGGTGPSALVVGASAVAVGSDTLITFIDGTTMTVLSTTPGSIKFTQ